MGSAGNLKKSVEYRDDYWKSLLQNSFQHAGDDTVKNDVTANVQDSIDTLRKWIVHKDGSFYIRMYFLIMLMIEQIDEPGT